LLEVIGIRCPYCQSTDLKVIDKRDASDFDSTRRRRECLGCKKRFTTYERIENVELTVIKKNGVKEPFNRQKLKDGILKACEKRPVSIEAIDKALDEIESEIRQKEEVTTQAIGELAITKLKGLDEVAYMRFASVYKSFDNLESFKKEIDSVKRGDTMSDVAPVTQVKKR
jgi:transcriptional repressor NrdR